MALLAPSVVRPPVEAAQDDLPRSGSFPEFVDSWNRLQGRDTPALHGQITAWLQERWQAQDPRLLLMVFRNAGKSTLVGLFCAWLLSGNANLRILVLSAEHALACKMTRNVRRIIERHPATHPLLPPRAEQWAADQFTVARDLDQRDPSLLARGIGGNVTGSRADIVVCDDVEVPNTADTPGKRAALRQALREIEFILVPGGMQLYIGTPHSYYSIYAADARPEGEEQDPFLMGFSRLELPIYDGSGRSRWPERFTEAHIRELEQRSGPMKFGSQMMLVPSNIRTARLDPDRLVPYAAELDCRQANGELLVRLGDHRMVSASCFWDPAYGRNESGDASVVAAVFSDGTGRFWLHRIRYLSLSESVEDETDDMIRVCREVVAFAEGLALPVVTVESNGFGHYLPGRLLTECRSAGLATAVVGHVSTRNKQQRILEAFDPLLHGRRLHAHESVWDTPFIAEMREWVPVRSARDDGLDAVSGCILAPQARLRVLPRLARGRAWSAVGRSFTAATAFRP